MAGLYAVTGFFVYLMELDGFSFFRWAPMIISWFFFRCIETVVYWLIRKKIYTKTWVWAHIITVITGFLIFWLYFPVVLLFNLDDYNSRYHLLTIKADLIWGTFIIGSLFFIVTIVESFYKKDPPVNDSTTVSPDSIPR